MDEHVRELIHLIQVVSKPMLDDIRVSIINKNSELLPCQSRVRPHASEMEKEITSVVKVMISSEHGISTTTG